MTPYFSDDSVTLYHGDCREVLPGLPARSVDVLLTDPPYFQVKDDDWDNQWAKRDDFLAWLGGVLDDATPALTPAASVWLFASPALTSTVEHQVIAPRFRVLNSIRWVKEAGWHQKAEIAAQRRYLTAWEGLILAERQDDAYDVDALALHKQVFAPIGRYITKAREAVGLSMNDVDVAFGYVRTKNPGRGTELCRRWEEGSSLPSAADYERLRQLLNLSRTHDELRREYEDLRRPFYLSKTGPVTDVWNFAPVMNYPDKHPCEKPPAMLNHMVGVSSRPGETVLDPFAGTGSTLLAARDTGRKAIGVELDERYCEVVARRLSQGALMFDEESA